MNKASAEELNDSIKIAGSFVEAGIRFVSVPVFNDNDYNDFSEVAIARLSAIADIIEAENNETTKKGS